MFAFIGCQSNESESGNIQERSKQIAERAKNAKPIDSVAAATAVKPVIKKSSNLLEQDTIIDRKNYLIDYKPGSSQTFDAHLTAAVFISPTTDEIDSLKKKYGEDDFYIIADDNVYYNSEAMQYLRSKNIDFQSTRKRFIKFTGQNKKDVYLDTDKHKSIWSLILFNGKDEPVVISPVDIEYEWKKLNTEE